MKSLVVGGLLLLAVPLSAQDQEIPGPAPELKRLERLIGTFAGKGTATGVPGQAAMDWTCESTSAWTLGNHFVQTDTLVDFGGKMPPLAFRELLGWDRETKRYVVITVGNTGEGSLTEVSFPTADTMVYIATKRVDGQCCAERHETTFTKDGNTYRMTMMSGTGAPFDCVTGAFRRVDKPKAPAVEACAAMAPPTAPMVKMHRIAGTYEVAGEMVMMPGMPVMKITGTDQYRTLFGGAVMQATTTGKSEGSPAEYRGETFFVWNETKQCFDLFGVDNMGWIGAMEQRFLADNQIVATSAACYMGQPMAQRMVMDLDPNGRIAKVTSFALTGASEPYCAFKATYKLTK